MSAYYNEIDPFAGAWLRELIKARLIADGEVDERDIRNVSADDVRGFTQCHFFAGIGGWSYALRLAGWPDDRPVWTGSCPCQPFSAAGKSVGGRDDRHLWPHWARLIRECRPVTVFGEQVESAIAHGWLDAVCDDLEAEAYACGAVCLPAASVGAFHIRQRLWFVAESARDGRQHGSAFGCGDGAGVGAGQPGRELGADGADDVVAHRDGSRRGAGRASEAGDGRGPARIEPARLCDALGVADAEHAERRAVNIHREDGCDGQDSRREEAHGESRTCGEVCVVAESERGRCDGQGLHVSERRSHAPVPVSAGASGLDLAGESASGRRERERNQPTYGEPLQASENTLGLGHAEIDGYERRSISDDRDTPHRIAEANIWADVEWLACRDGKYRPTQPGLFPLAHGVRNRVGTLRGAGNAIVPQVAAEVIAAYMEIAP